MRTYKVSGVVLGLDWTEEKTAYPARKFTCDKKSDVKKIATKWLESGELDSGFGFRELIGAYLNVEVLTTRTIGKKEFQRVDTLDPLILGSLNESEIDFLIQCLFDFH